MAAKPDPVKNDEPNSHSELKASSRVFNSCVHPFLSGIFGSLASLVAKHTFSPDFGGCDKQFEVITLRNNYMEYALRVVLFLSTLYLNSLMLKFFINSLKRNGATLAKVLSLSISFFMNGLISYFYFGEPMKLRWCMGLFLIMIGIYFLAKDKDKQDKNRSKCSTKVIQLTEEKISSKACTAN